MFVRLPTPLNVMRTALPCLTLLLCLTAPGITSADASNVSCDNLGVSVSSDKNYYVFTASASGDNNGISGYTFNFGDKQSYTVSFASSSTQDRHSATVTHTYQNAGSYTPTVQVITKNGNKMSLASSPNCESSITVQPTSNSLPDTGTHNTLQIFVVACFLGITVYEFYLRRVHIGRQFGA